MSEFEEKLRKIVNEGELWVNEPMSAHTTFRIGGPVSYTHLDVYKRQALDCVYR